MTFEEFGTENEKKMMLLPGTCCDWQTNFCNVFDSLAEKYHLICVNYDGFDGGSDIFSDMITVTEKIEKYLKRYKKYFHDPDIREFDMQHEQWLFGEKKYAEPVLKAIDEFMQMTV